MPSRRGALLLLLLAACPETFDLHPTQFACSDDSECGEGTVCLLERCQLPWICGDGVIQAGERCDDGQPSRSGGCNECAIDFGFTCTGTIGEASPCERTRYVQIAGGAFHVCALALDGLIECTGRNVEGQLDAPNELGPFSFIEGGNDFTCAIREADDLALCWGSNAVEGEIVGKIEVPADLGAVEQISAGAYHGCARTRDDFARCWGRVNARETNPIPEDVAITDVAAGSFHTCLLLESGEIDCWGDSDKVEPPELVGPFVEIDNGFFHTCALRASGTIACWGRDSETLMRTVPPSEDGFVELAGGHFHHCARRSDGRVTCWGRPALEQDYGQSDPPPGAFTQLTAGARFTCGLRDDRSIECWGAIDAPELHP